MVQIKKLKNRFLLTPKLILFVALFLMGCISCQNNNLGISFIIIQVLYIIVQLLYGNIDNAIIANNIFLGISIESSAFIFNDNRTLFCYAYMPYVHRWGCLVLELTILGVYIIKNNGIIKLSKQNRWCTNFIKSLYILFSIGVFISFLNIVMNDNNIANISWYTSQYLKEIGYWSILITNCLMVYLALNFSSTFYTRFRTVLLDFFVALIITSIITVLLGWHGHYSYHTTVLMMPLVSFFAVTLIIFPCYKEYANKSYFWIALTGFMCMCVRTSPLLGKWVLLVICTVLTYLWLSLTNRRFFKVLLVIMLAMVIGLSAGSYLIKNNELLNYKLKQALGSINLFSGAWIQNMSASPKYRIEEFYNILLEYIDKPWSFILGKGIGGTITHRTNWLGWSLDPGSFTMNQRQSGVYNELHETINIMFLKFGLLGLWFFSTNVINVIKNIRKSPWLLMGVIWFAFFISSYISLYIVAGAFLLGMYESDRFDNSVMDRGE